MYIFRASLVPFWNSLWKSFCSLHGINLILDVSHRKEWNQEHLGTELFFFFVWVIIYLLKFVHFSYSTHTILNKSIRWKDSWIGVRVCSMALCENVGRGARYSWFHRLFVFWTKSLEILSVWAAFLSFSRSLVSWWKGISNQRWTKQRGQVHPGATLQPQGLTSLTRGQTAFLSPDFYT